MPLTEAEAPSDPGEFAVDGVPVNDRVAPEPALSESVTSNEPGPGAIAATLASLKDNLSVAADAPPRWIVPTPTIDTSTNAGRAVVGWGVGVAAGVGCGVGVLVQAARTTASASASGSPGTTDNRLITTLYADCAHSSGEAT